MSGDFSRRGLVAYPNVVVEVDVPVTMRDGVKLFADVYRPAGNASYPTLVIRTPYGKTSAQSEIGYAHPAWYASQGYVVLVQDTRGRWSSEGRFYPFLNEGEDGFDTVEFAARLPRSTGEVGTFGFSYAGLNQILTAVLRPPSLRAIAPAFTSSSPYESWSYHQGAPATAFLTFWSALLGMGEASRNGDLKAVGQLSRAMTSGSPVWALPANSDPILTSDLVPYYHDWLSHPTYDDYWRRWTLDEDFSRINVPGLHTLGQWDLFAKGNLRTFNGLKANSAAGGAQKLLVVPFPHLPWSPLDEKVNIGANVVDDRHIRFFDEHLKGKAAASPDANVAAYVVGEGWRNLSDWPSADGVSYYLHSDGRANTAWGDGKLKISPASATNADIFIYDPNQPVLSVGGHSTGVEGVQPVGPKVQDVAERSKTVLVYTSDLLEHPLTLVGNVTVCIFATTTVVDTDFTARLTVVDDHGVSRNLLEGIVRASHRHGSVSPIPPGSGINEYRIDLGPIARAIPSGSRLRVDVTSSDFPQWGRNSNLSDGQTTAAVAIATQVIYHGPEFPSRIVLPIV